MARDVVGEKRKGIVEMTSVLERTACVHPNKHNQTGFPRAGGIDAGGQGKNQKNGGKEYEPAEKEGHEFPSGG